MEGSPKNLADLGATRVALKSLASCSLLLFTLVWLAIFSVETAKATPPTEIVQSAAVHVHHVFVVVLENEPYEVTFGKQSLAPYLAHTLPKEGILLANYYGIGHHSLDNYIAMISGQAPNRATQDDCKTYSEFRRNSTERGAYEQMSGSGCIYPADVKSLPDQLDAAGLSWKGYMEDMGADSSRESATCGHVLIGAEDFTHRASAKDQYAAKHNPFVYFHSIIDDPVRCAKHVVNFNGLARDLDHIDTTPNFAFITPNLCHDGHDAPCADGEPGGLISVDAFLRIWIPRILASPAYRKDGLLVITFDEGTDGQACCHERGLPSGPLAGEFGPGGGRTGAVLLSPFIASGTISTKPYNHYSLLRTIEDEFGLRHLGYAGAPHLHGFGRDVFRTSSSTR